MAYWQHASAIVDEGAVLGEGTKVWHFAHVCAGAPLARKEVAVLYDRLFEHTSDLRLSEAHHGPKGARRIDYEPSYIIRGLANLHVEFVGK